MTKKKTAGWKAADGRHAAGFLVNLDEILQEVQAADRRGRALALREAFAAALKLIRETSLAGRKLVFIGNGGSAAIASHQAVDYSKNGGVEAVSFNDASLLTCFGNDLGFENVFGHAVKTYGKKGDLLMAISSSGKSPNILNGVKAARAAGMKVVTFSGFTAENPLRATGDVNFHVPVRAYGLVEVSHLVLIHAMLREIIYLNPKVDRRGY